MVDIRPPVFPIGPLPRLAVKSHTPRAVLNLLLKAPTLVRVMQELRVFSVYQKLGITLPDTLLTYQKSPSQSCSKHRSLHNDQTTQRKK